MLPEIISIDNDLLLFTTGTKIVTICFVAARVVCTIFLVATVTRKSCMMAVIMRTSGYLELFSAMGT